MATAAPPSTIEPPPDVQPFEITSDLLFQMVEAGLLATDRRVFLWDGRLYEKMAKTVAHSLTGYAIQEALRPLVAPDWLIWPENPIALDARHAPLPDVTLIRGPVATYERERRHPEARDVGLIVEIAVTSLRKDLGERAEKFARALVPNYWVVDVPGHRIIAHSRPEILRGVGGYRSILPHDLAGQIRLVLDGREIGPIPVSDLIR